MVIEWRPLIVGILFTLAIYAVSVISSQSAIAFLALLLGGAVVGVMIGGEIKESLLNGIIFGVITSVIIFIVTVIEILTSALGSAILGIYVEELLLILGIEIVLGIVGSILGSYIRSEALMTED